METKDKSVEELKVLAYDMLASIQALQQNLGLINQEIARKSQEKETEKEKVSDSVKPVK